MRAIMRAVMAAMITLSAGAGAAAAAELRVLTWSSYLSPQLVERFEKETGVTVKLDTVTNYVDLLKPLETGASGYDIAFPADFQVRDLIAKGLIQNVHVDRLPNFWNIEDVWRSRPLDPRNEYTVPHVWGTTAFVVDTARYKGDINTLALLFNPPPSVGDKIMLMDSGYDMVQLALVWLKLPRCSTRPEHLAKAEALLLPMLRRYPLADIDTVIDNLASGRYVVGVAWNGDALKARRKLPSLRYAYPREGSLVWTDVLVVPKGAPNRADALKFMAFMMRPEIAAMESNYNGYANMIRGSEPFMDAGLVAAPEIITPIASSLDFFTYCDNTAESRQEVFWKALREKAGK
jgi:spermidine/putrescine transport system substrate-binding protein